MLRWICRRHSNDVAQHVETPGESTIFDTRHDFIVAWRIHYTMTVKLIDTATETFLV